MSEYAMFYNSENGDRVYDADSFSNWLKKFFTTGVFEGDCQVTALGSMVVNLAPGYANIMGKVKELENQTFTLEPADGSYPRIDTIVIERNDTDRDITAKLVTGELSGNDPVPTARVWENGVYQLIVAEVYVAAGATEVTQANITDKRSDPDVCGIVAGTVTEMDFSQFTAQFEAYFAEFQASNLEEFDEWFQHMKDQLDTDAAGHLQNEIDDINAKIPSGASSSNKLVTESEINDNLSVRYNEETDYLQVKYNGVWTNAIYIGKKLDPTKLTLTQEEFIAICNQGLQSMMTVGAIVTLNNEKCSQYEVIDVNHDSTTGTVDLMAHTQVGKMRFDGSSQDYNVSEIRTWLNSNYHDLFDLEIRNLMQPMTVVTKGLTQQDKIKLLSWRELGLQYDSNYMDSTDGGEKYSVFTAGAYLTAIPDRWRAAGNYGDSSTYWLRSRDIGDSLDTWFVGSSGACNNNVWTVTRGVLPVLRF